MERERERESEFNPENPFHNLEKTFKDKTTQVVGRQKHINN